MTVAYNQRDTPLVLDALNTLSAAVRLSYDFTGVDTRPVPQAYTYQGGTPPTLVKTGTVTQVTQNGIPGCRASATSLYEYTSTTDYGLQVGTGDWTLAVVFSTGAALPSTNGSCTLAEIRNASGTILASLVLSEFASNGWYLNAGATGGIGSSGSAVYYGANKTVAFFVTRRSGVISAWNMEAAPTATLARRYNDGAANSTNWDSASATRVRVAYNGAVAVDAAVHGVKFWNAGLTDTQMRDVGRDWFALDENSAVADSLAITSPTTGAAIPATTTISGTYTYAVGAPTAMEVQHGAGSWTALTGFTAGAGTWSGSVVLPVAAAASLRARDSVAPSTVSPDITGVSVVATSIAFAAPNHASYGAAQAVPYRVFQRDGSNQATGVRLVGTYSGAPTSIEWRFNGGAWATLVPTPSGGTFDATVTLTGPAQGALQVRFSNDVGVSASLSSVGVGDVFIAMGQSNHVGAATSYVAPTAPVAHPGWVPVKYGKDHTWAPIVETAGDKFDDDVAVYAAFGSGSPLGSYFGALSTLIMASGVPVAIVPSAKGSTSMVSWAVGGSPTDTNTLFGASTSVTARIGAHRAVLWWQGEAEGTGSADASLLSSRLDAVIDQWTVTVGTPWYVIAPSSSAMGNSVDGATVRAALLAMPATNAAVLAAADMDVPTVAYTGIHYLTGVEIQAAAQRVFDMLGYPPPEGGGGGGGGSPPMAGSGSRLVGITSDGRIVAILSLPYS